MRVGFVQRFIASSEKKSDTPERRESDHRVYDPGEQGGLSAKEPCNDIKSEDANASPVYTADNEQW